MYRVGWPIASELIAHGDLLLLRASHNPISRVIAGVGRSVYCHAARAAWIGGELRCLEVREWYGARNVPLEGEVRRYPGRWDVFQCNPKLGLCSMATALRATYEPQQGIAYLLGLVGRRYGWGNLARIAALHVPLLRVLIRPPLDDDATNGWLPVCSHAQAQADRISGVDPVKNLADRVTEPADLARSLFYQYRFTLEP